MVKLKEKIDRISGGGRCLSAFIPFSAIQGSRMKQRLAYRSCTYLDIPWLSASLR